MTSLLTFWKRLEYHLTDSGVTIPGSAKAELIVEIGGPYPVLTSFVFN
jgi:hypothetical protein